MLFLLFAVAVLAQNCTNGLHIIVARASLEPPGNGILGLVANRIIDNTTGSIASVDYPATLNNYYSSESQGVAELTKMIQDYSEQCPDGLLALLGYSQGGQAIADVLCGSSAAGFPETEPLSMDYGRNIVAALIMGDPSYVPDQPYSAGTSGVGGVSACILT